MSNRNAALKKTHDFLDKHIPVPIMILTVKTKRRWTILRCKCGDYSYMAPHIDTIVPMDSNFHTEFLSTLYHNLPPKWKDEFTNYLLKLGAGDFEISRCKHTPQIQGSPDCISVKSLKEKLNAI
jgi:hypothetical protein